MTPEAAARKAVATSARRFGVALLLITLAGGALRLSLAEATHPVLLVGDEHYYVEVADRIRAGEGHHSPRFDAFAAWPPGQAYWLSLFRGQRARVTAQVVLGTALVALVGLLGGLLVDRRSGLAAAALAAVLPELLAFSHYLWATTLFSLLALAGCCAVALAARGRTLAWAGLAGLLFGLAALTRETGAAFAAGGAAWLLWRAPRTERRRHAGAAALLLVLPLLVIAPWTLRNLEHTGQWIPVSTVGWMALREGNTIHPDDWMLEDHGALSAFRRRYIAMPEARRGEVARGEALALIREQQPGWIGKKLVRNLAWLTTPDSFLLYKLSYRAYPDLSLARARFVLVSCVALYVVVFALGVTGLALARGSGAASFALAMSLPLLALHVLANASPRYRVPLLPFLLVGSGAFLCQWREIRSGWRRPPALVAAALLLFFFAVSVPGFAPDAAKLWARGTVFEVR